MVSALAQQGRKCKPQAFSLACAWTKETPSDLWRDMHTPAIWPHTGHREASGLLFTPGLHLYMYFLCNSEIKTSELTLNKEKKERKLSLQFWKLWLVLIDMSVIEVPFNHRNKIAACYAWIQVVILTMHIIEKLQKIEDKVKQDGGNFSDHHL